MIWKEEDSAESTVLMNFCFDGAVPVWVLLAAYQLARSGGVDMSPCLPLIIKCLRSSEGKGARKG